MKKAEVLNFFVVVIKIISEVQRRFLLSNRSRVKRFSSPEFSNEQFEERRIVSGDCQVAYFNPNLREREGKYFASKEVIRIKQVTADLKSGLIADRERRLVSKSSPWSTDYLHLSRTPLLKVSGTLSRVLPLESKIKILPSQSYYHWLIEGLPNFILTLRDNNEAKIVVKYDPPRYVRDFANFSGIEIHESSEFIRAAEVVFVSQVESSGWTNPEDVATLQAHFRKLLCAEQSKMTRKLYVSRSRSSRSPRFERNLEEFLSGEGWQIVFAEDFSLQEQVRTFSESRIIMGVHGAGLSNAIWHQRGEKLIEIRRDSSPNCFARLAHAVKLEYQGIRISDIEFHSKEVPESVKSSIMLCQ